MRQLRRPKLGSGGISAISTLLSLDAKTLRRGLKELALHDDPAQSWVRKKAVDASS
jgi:hypothetical protein